MKQKRMIAMGSHWIDKVEAGVPFSLTSDASQERHVPVGEGGRRTRSDSMSPRTLRQLGELMTVAEVALFCRVNERTIYDWIYEKRLRSIRVGRSVRVAKCDLEEFLCA